MPIKSILASLLAVFMLAACETAPDPRYTGTGPLAVVSAIGDDFEIISIGTTVFQNKEGSAETDWNIDGAIESAVKRELAGAFEFADSTADRDAIAEETDTALRQFFGPNKIDFAKIVSDNVQVDADNAPSAILLIAPAEHGNYDARGNPRYIRAGMYSDSFFGMRNTNLFLGAQLILLDAQSMEILRQRL